MSRPEPKDRFDLEWPHALSEELGRIPMPPRPARGRYELAGKRRSLVGRRVAGPAFGAAALAALVAVTAVLGTAGRLPFQQRATLPRTARIHEQPQTNQGLPPVTAPAIAPSLAPIVTARVGSYTYGWTAAPAAPQPWTPGAVNDWDLLATSDVPSDQGGTMQARFGPDCSPPPATHTVKALADSAYLCRGQLMTAINGGGDAPKTYGGVVFAPAQLAEFSTGTSTISWQVSTLRASTNDWWDVWLTPFDENLVAPVAPSEAPAFNGAPGDAVRVHVTNGICPGSGQPATLGTSGGVPVGTVFSVDVFANHRPTSVDVSGFPPCAETAAGSGGTSSYRLDVSRNHVRFVALRSGGGAPIVYADATVNLPFGEAVVQFLHHSFVPQQGCASRSACGPNTYQWSAVSIDPATAFTMLRPNGASAVHGQPTTVQLPQPAPAGAALRFYAFGSVRVAFDGGPPRPAAPQQGQRTGTGEASYWTPVPAGTTAVTLSGSAAGGMPWWVQDVSVWAPPA